MTEGTEGFPEARLPVEHDQQGHAFELRPIDCPTCGVDDTKVLGYRGGATHRHGRGIRSRIVRCRRCGLIYANPFPSPVNPDSVYGDPAAYFARHDQEARIAEYRELARELKRRSGTEQPQTLDVGSGRGDFIYSATLEGMSAVTGVEFATAMVAHARERFDVDLFHGTLEAFGREWDGPPFDVVVLNAILEHVSDPDSFVRTVADLTHEGSLLYLDIPREPHLAASLGNKVNSIRRRPEVFNISPTWPPFHVFGFSEEALKRLLAKHGFRMEDVRVWCDPIIFSNGSRRDALAARATTLVNQIANLTGTAGNMFVWARRT